jgi:LysM repeat protein/ethanolamine utilization microcompartment shell protein EutS
MTHDSDEQQRTRQPVQPETDEQRFGWHPDVPEPTEVEQRNIENAKNDAEPVHFQGQSLIGDSPTDDPAYWTPGQPGDLPPTIIQRKAPPSTQELLARYSKPAMMALTVAAVSSAGVAQNTQGVLAQTNNTSDADDTGNVRSANVEQQPQLYQLANDTRTEIDVRATGNSADRTDPFIYTVEEGDWVRHIARDFGLQTMTIVWNNNLPDPDYILPGQELLILPVDGVMVEVQPGETLNSLATEYGVNTTAIINYEPNGITDPDLIQPGQVLIIPGGVPPEAPESETSVAADVSASTSTSAHTTNAAAPVPEQSSETAEAPAPAPETEQEPEASFASVGDSVTVAPGDTIADIAQRHGVSVSELLEVNEVVDADAVYPGDQLFLPQGIAAQEAPAPEAAPEPEPEPDSQPEQQTQPTPEPETAPEPEPAPEPTPAPQAEPEPEPTPEPAPEPTPAPQPDPTPTPQPEPTATPQPEPTPTPEPAPSNSGVPSGIEGQLEYYANQYGLDANLVKAVAWRESGWNQGVRSSAGAIGVMQIMPGTADWINNNLVSRNLDVRGSTADNIEAGTAYLAHRIGQFGDVERGLAAYFMGPTTVQNHGITATGRQYVDRILEIRDYIAANGGPPSWR